MSTTAQDLRAAARMLRRAPVFATFTVLTLALGLGANTAVFTVAYSVLLKPLPYADPDRLVVLWGSDRTRATSKGGVSYLDFEDWRAGSSTLANLSASFPWKKAVAGEGAEPEAIVGAAVSAGFFSTLGIRPVLGRGLLPSDAQAGAERVAVGRADFLRRRFGREQDAVGRTLSLDGTSYRIVGVLPPSFLSPLDRAEVCWTPLHDRWPEATRRQRTLHAIGRLKPGVSIEQAQRELSILTARQASDHPETNSGYGVGIQRLHDAEIGPIRPVVAVLFVAVALVLLVTCLNLSHALLARSLARRGEVDIRTALGASRPQLIRQILTESLLLSFGGGGLGLLVGAWVTRALKVLGEASLPRLEEIRPDGATFAFAFALAVLTGVLLGLAPALYLSNSGATARCRQRRESRFWRQVPRVLVVSQVALATILAIGAGLLTKSFVGLRAVDPGFEPRGLYEMSVKLPLTRYPFPQQYPSWPRVTGFYTEVLERLGRIPDIDAMSLALSNPLQRGLTTKIRAEEDGRDLEGVSFRPVSPGYFRTVRQRLVLGRDLTTEDDLDAPAAVVINEELAERLYPGGHPIGRSIHFEEVSWEIVGVVADSRFGGLAADTPPAVYPPLAQSPMSDVSILVRSRSAVDLLAQQVRQAIREIDSGLPASDLAAMTKVLSGQTARPRLVMLLLGGFAVLALALAVGGIYGLILFHVGQQTKSIGIRLALGARRIDVVLDVAGRASALLAAGLAVGVAVSSVLVSALSSLLFGVSAHDVQTFLVVPIALAAAGLLACLMPSLRILGIEPMMALRSR